VFFEIFDKVVFSTKLKVCLKFCFESENFVVVSEMVDLLVRSQVYMIHDFMNPFFFGPVNIPINIVVSFFPRSSSQAFQDAIFKGCFEFNVGSGGRMIILFGRKEGYG